MQPPRKLQTVPLSHTALLLEGRESSQLEWVEGDTDVYTSRPSIKSTRHICIHHTSKTDSNDQRVITKCSTHKQPDKLLSEKLLLETQHRDLEKNEIRSNRFRYFLRILMALGVICSLIMYTRVIYLWLT